MRNYIEETAQRIAFIQKAMADARADGIIFANSGGKDAVLVGILCKMACDNTVGLILPCRAKRNYGEDKDHAELIGQHFDIKHRMIDLTDAAQALIDNISQSAPLDQNAAANIAPRLRMTTLYAVAVTENRLVAGTGNRSERHVGYFTKFGDGAFDFNPIADLTVREVYEFLRHLGAPDFVIDKAPSAGLYDGQTDEAELGMTYDAIDDYLLFGKVSDADKIIIDRRHSASEHKRKPPLVYTGSEMV